MELITGTKDFFWDRPSVVAIGKFDGRHRGHDLLIGKMKELRQKEGLSLVLLTFDTPPQDMISGHAAGRIQTLQERRELLEEAGADCLVEYPFDAATRDMPAEEFVRKVLLCQLSARAVAAGTDCAFGRGREGSADLLRLLSEKYGFSAVIVDKCQADGKDISSTRVRASIESGRMEEAKTLLGHDYFLRGRIEHGKSLGKSFFSFPTANMMIPAEKLLPPRGVYYSRISIGGREYDAVTNIGVKPTVGEDFAPGAETFIFGMDEGQSLYGMEAELKLLHFSRPEKRFSSMAALREQIGRDVRGAEEYFADCMKN